MYCEYEGISASHELIPSDSDPMGLFPIKLISRDDNSWREWHLMALHCGTGGLVIAGFCVLFF